MADIKMFVHNLGDTSDPNLKRVLDLNGDWTHYKVLDKNLYVPAVNHILKIGFPKGIGFYNYLLSVSKEEAQKILEEAGERGARVHDVIRTLIGGTEVRITSLFPHEITGRPEPISKDEWRYVLAFRAFCEAYKPEQISVEETVATKEYAGTRDFVGTVLIRETPKAEPKRVKIILDWKTSGGVYDDYKAQVAAYYVAKPDDVEYTAVVRLGTRHQNGGIKNCGYEVKFWNKEQTMKNYNQGFMSALNLYNMQKTEDFEFDGSEIPSVIKIEIPYYQKPKAPATKKVAKPKVAVKKNVKTRLQG